MKYPMLILLLLLSLNPLSNALSQSSNWPAITNIKSGDHKLLLQTKVGPSATLTYSQGYSSSSQTYTSLNKPNVIICMRDMKIQLTSNPIDFYVTVTQASITTTGFTSTLTINSNNTFTLLYYMYLAVDPAFAANSPYYFQTMSFNCSNFTGTIGASQVFSTNTNFSISDYASAVVVPYIISFSMSSASEYSYSATGTMINPTTAQLTLKSNSTLLRVEIMLVVVDKVSTELHQLYFLDYGDYNSWNNDLASSSSWKIFTMNYYNFVQGITAIRISATEAINFQVAPSYLPITQTNYLYLRYSNIQWRKRQCINVTMPYYLIKTRRCYDICPVGYGNNTADLYCLACHYSCLSCLSDGVSCQTCNVTNSRTLVGGNKTCPCDSGYADSGVAVCTLCHYSCLTCSNSASFCMSCTAPSTRTLVNNSCPCNVGKFDTLLNSSTCQPCDYTCLTCLNISTNCTSCDNTSHRFIQTNINKCPCSTGFADNNTLNCVTFTCSAPCVSCSILSTNCTLCNSVHKRYLSNYSCLCLPGYSSPSTGLCTQICGDGQMIQNSTQCDDGNAMSGDGCSSTCHKQTGYNCTNTNRTSPTVCIFIQGYTMTLSSLIKDPESNYMSTQVIINPMPPGGSTPYLQTLSDSIDITSYSITSSQDSAGNPIGLLSMNLLIKKQLPNDPTISIALTNLSSSSSIKLQASNNLVIKYYTASYFSLYRGQTILVWVYVSLLWLSFVGIMIYDYTLFGGVFEIFVYSALAWVAIEGQKTFSLLFQPLSNLRYIFGFNLQIGTKSSLLQIYNISFIINILPIIIFSILFPINKKYPGKITTKLKRFVLFDLSYAWLAITGILISYGLSLTAISYNGAPVELASVIIGIIYLLIFCLASYSLFVDKHVDELNPKLQITKKNVCRTNVIPITLSAGIVLSFVYLTIKNQTRIGSLIMMGYFAGLLVLYGFINLFINKIRYMSNALSLLLIYGCVLLINTVSAADWAGSLILGLMYIQLVVNVIFIFCERPVNLSEELKDVSETDRKRQENRTNLNIDNQLSSIQRHFSYNGVVEEPKFYPYQSPKSKINNIIVETNDNNRANSKNITMNEREHMTALRTPAPASTQQRRYEDTNHQQFPDLQSRQKQMDQL